MSDSVIVVASDEDIEIDLGEGASIVYTSSFISSKRSKILYDHLIATLPLDVHKVFIHGKWIDQPRLGCWVGDGKYTYSGLTLDPASWDSKSTYINERVARFCNEPFKGFLANYYEDGSKYISWHGDKEISIEKESTIASLSLGAERDFYIRRKISKPGKLNDIHITLGDGSLLQMRGTMQRDWIHTLPKRARCTEGRLNLTFRVYKKK